PAPKPANACWPKAGCLAKLLACSNVQGAKMLAAPKSCQSNTACAKAYTGFQKHKHKLFSIYACSASPAWSKKNLCSITKSCSKRFKNTCTSEAPPSAC